VLCVFTSIKQCVCFRLHALQKRLLRWMKPSTTALVFGALSKKTTLLRWHRELFHLFWKHKSKAHTRKPKLSLDTIALIKEMAAKNRLWGAERIRGELLKLDIRVSKRTIQKDMRQSRSRRPSGQNWRTFLRNHAAEVWACDFLQEKQLYRLLKAYIGYFNQSRPHQGLRRRIPDPPVHTAPSPNSLLVFLRRTQVRRSPFA
jgi:hypothetical protein